jgi:hypothetical protein
MTEGFKNGRIYFYLYPCIKMPILRIVQPIKYTSSHFENLLEKELLEYGISLPEPGIYSPEELKDGIYRTIKEKTDNNDDIEIKYWKFFEKENFIRISGKNTHINEKRLRKILNSNRIYAETISLRLPYNNTITEIGIDNTKPYSNKRKNVEVNISESPTLFTDMLLSYVQSFYKIKKIHRGLLYDNLEHIQTSESLESVSKIIKDSIGVNFKMNHYIKMLVYYLIKKRKND